MYVDPDCQQCYREEVVEQDKRATYDACQQSNRPINTLPAAFKVSEAAKLQSFELGV